MAPFTDEYLFVEIANKVCNYDVYLLNVSLLYIFKNIVLALKFGSNILWKRLGFVKL